MTLYRYEIEFRIRKNDAQPAYAVTKLAFGEARTIAIYDTLVVAEDVCWILNRAAEREL
jgi:hypothetical protein